MKQEADYLEWAKSMSLDPTVEQTKRDYEQHTTEVERLMHDMLLTPSDPHE
jgi:hypothetical protein